jgi:hypothetical protein
MNPTLRAPLVAALLASACASHGGEPGHPDAARTGPDAATTETPATPPAADAAPAADLAAEAPATADCPASFVYCDTLRPLPPTIKETGFFPAAPDLGSVRANMVAYEPTWPLWSNGLGKERYAILPAGKTIDTKNRKVWDFPVGTLFLKTFFSDGAGGARKPLETRLIRRVDDPDPFKQWQFAVYQWNDAGTDATLLSLDARVPVMATVGKDSFMHVIPSREDCGKCHTANDTTVIGFDELRLNWTPPGKDRSELQRVAALGLLGDAPPADPATITDPDPDLRQVKGYVLGNCVHCHNGRNSEVVDMHPDVLVSNVVCQRTNSNGTLDGWRVAPGQPGMSVLYMQLARMMRPGINPMPPVGVQRPDTAAMAVVSRWITSLHTTCPPKPRTETAP